MSDPKPSGIEFPPANIWMRMAAYAMDMLLILAVISAILNSLPETAVSFDHESQKQGADFNEVFIRSQEFAKEHPEAAISLAFYYLSFPLTPFLYFFVSEILLGGYTLGKKTFNLRTAYRDSPRLPPLGAHALRSMVKSIASIALISQDPLLLVFFINFLIAFYNPGRRAGHDLISRTSVVPGYLPEDDLATGDER